LVQTDALCGFREPSETYQMFSTLGLADALALVEPLADAAPSAEERLATVFARLLRLTSEQRSMITDVVRVAETTGGSEELASFARTAIELHACYPNDPGVLAALLMNRITLHPGDALYMPPGNLHAYLSGGGVEIMANSDNVMRGGLTPKYVNVEELLAIVDFTPLSRPHHSCLGVTWGLALCHARTGVCALEDRDSRRAGERSRGNVRAHPARS